MRVFIQISLLSLVLSLSSFTWARDCGRIISKRGQVEILRVKKGQENNENPVREVQKTKARQKIRCSDVLVTGKASRAKVRFKYNAVLTMGPHSRISILEYLRKTGEPNLLKLTYGKVRALFKEEKKQDEKSKKSKKNTDKTSRFRIKTPSAVAGVRGTDFYISFEPNTRVTEQATIEGQVEVEQVGTEQAVVVESGQQVAVDQVVEIKELPPEPKVAIAVEKPKALPQPKKKAEVKVEAKPLVVIPIVPEVKTEIRQVSSLVKNDKEFVSKKAVEILGEPEKWTPPPDEVPMDLKEIKEEF